MVKYILQHLLYSSFKLETLYLFPITATNKTPKCCNSLRTKRRLPGNVPVKHTSNSKLGGFYLTHMCCPQLSTVPVYIQPRLPFLSHSRVLSTERTILSPFTKEYRALGTRTGIYQFLDCPSRGPPIKHKTGVLSSKSNLILALRFSAEESRI